MKNNITHYKDGVVARIKNRRISVLLKDNKITVIMCSALPKDELNFNGNTIIKGRIKLTGFHLTEDGAKTLLYCLHSFLTKTQTHETK